MSTTINLNDYRPEDGGVLDIWLELKGSDWLYITGLENWFQWTGTHWQRDESQTLQKQIQTLLDSINQQAVAEVAACDGNDDDITKKIMRAWVAATKRSAARVNSITTMAQAQRAVAATTINAGNLLNLENGTLNLDTLTQHGHNREDRLTYCLPYPYDPDALAPTFEKFLSEILVHERQSEVEAWRTDIELCTLCQCMMGYALTNSTQYEAMFWLAGKGANGKSTLIHIINSLLGDLAMPVSFAAMGRPGNYTLAKIPGKRILFSTEAPQKGTVAEELMKAIVSGDPLEARPIYGDVINFVPVAKCLWAMNKKPRIDDDSDGFWRRLRLLPFHRQFNDDEKDTNLKEKLLAELPGILVFALNGLLRLRQLTALPESKAVKEAVAAYRIENNPVQLWLEDRTTPTETADTLSSVLYKDYVHWCAENGRTPANSTTFGTALKLQVASKRVTVGQVYAVALVAPTPHNLM